MKFEYLKPLKRAKKKDERRYVKARQLMHSDKRRRLRRAEKLFRSISDYKNSLALAEACYLQLESFDERKASYTEAKRKIMRPVRRPIIITSILIVAVAGGFVIAEPALRAGTTLYADAVTSLNITTLSIPGYMKQLPDGIFHGCDTLVAVDVSDTTESLGARAFYGCHNLQYVRIGRGITVISNEAFRDCTSLTQLTVSQNVREIGSGAFNGAPLERVYFEGDAHAWSLIEIGAHNTELEEATVYFYSETRPDGDGFWHYVNGSPVLWSN